MSRRPPNRPSKALATGEAAQTAAFGGLGLAGGTALVVFGGIYIALGIGWEVIWCGLILILHWGEMGSAIRHRKLTRHLLLPAVVVVAVPVLTSLVAYKDPILAWFSPPKAAPPLEIKSADIRFDRFDAPGDALTIHPGHPVELNYYFSNHNNTTAIKALSKGFLTITNQPDTIDSQIFDKVRYLFSDIYLRNYQIYGADMNPTDRRYGTAILPTISKRAFEDLRQNRAQLILITGVGWLNSAGNIDYSFQCSWATGLPRDGNAMLASWHPCAGIAASAAR